MLTFQPREPRYTAGLRLRSVRIHVRDHKLRELSINDRTLEAHYGGFVLSQARKGADEARRLALDVWYGNAGEWGRIAGHVARIYELGPEPAPDDIDGRSPAVVTWQMRICSFWLRATRCRPVSWSGSPSPCTGKDELSAAGGS